MKGLTIKIRGCVLDTRQLLQKLKFLKYDWFSHRLALFRFVGTLIIYDRGRVEPTNPSTHYRIFKYIKAMMMELAGYIVRQKKKPSCLESKGDCDVTLRCYYVTIFQTTAILNLPIFPKRQKLKN